MKNAATIFGRVARKKVVGPSINWVLPEQLVGLEIEVESYDSTYPSPESYQPYWSQKRDGSLRNGVEYVLTSPMKGETLSQAVSAIFNDGVFARSTTGSTHIHLDMMEEDTSGEHIKVLTLLIYCLESAIFAIADRGREFCGYTNKLCTAPDHLLANVLGATEEGDYEAIRRLSMDMNAELGRYYGLNLMALAKFCTVEFRYFPTCTSMDELVSWIQLVMAFKKAAVDIGTPQELFTIFSNEDAYDQFLAKYFTPWLATFKNEAPQYTAIVMLKKAVAVAGSKILRGESVVDKFDVRAVLKNKKLAKFAKKRPPRPEQITPLPFIYAQGSNIPRDSAPGQIMFFGSHVYVWLERDWRTWNDIYDRDMAGLLVARASLETFGPGAEVWVRAQGVTNEPTIRSLINNMQNVQREIANIDIPNSGFRSRSKHIEYTGLEALEEEVVGDTEVDPGPLEVEVVVGEAPPSPVQVMEININTPTTTGRYFRIEDIIRETEDVARVDWASTQRQLFNEAISRTTGRF